MLSSVKLGSQFDILPRLKPGDSYGAHPGIEPA